MFGDARQRRLVKNGEWVAEIKMRIEYSAAGETVMFFHAELQAKRMSVAEKYVARTYRNPTPATILEMATGQPGITCATGMYWQAKQMAAMRYMSAVHIAVKEAPFKSLFVACYGGGR